MTSSFDKQFELRYLEMNFLGEATPTAILALLEEAAADHCYDINYSLYDLLDRNIGWVLIGGYMQMERYPKYKEKITIRTWLSNYSTVRGIRENIIYDESGAIIGRAKGLWVFFDIVKRRPTAIFDDIKTKWSFDAEESIAYDVTHKIAPVENATYRDMFNVYKFDVDTNEHVNNIRYLHWVMDTIPKEVLENNFLYSIDGRFIAEAQYGDVITSLTERNGNDLTFNHTIKTDKDRICATAITVWRPLK